MKDKTWGEIKSMTCTELESRLDDLQDRIFKLKFRHSVTPVKDPLEIRKIRRNIARVKMLITQKKEFK
ncbi:MAG: 50S ribosomal protein L29 [Endomicrobium sp.]|jgi:large subunit ribosomal protein L29|nr:50S ribosomal protein L29 [Endomicrobium sp.]